MKLKPRLVIATGISCTGKSTTLNELVKQVPTAFILNKDSINQACLHVVPTVQGKLPLFEEYVTQDNVFPNHARKVETPFGELIQIDPKNEFYGRHVRDQTYLAITRIARTNLDLGKTPVVDCIVIRQIQDGTLRKFIEQPDFKDSLKYLIHFIADEEDCYRRHVERARNDREAAVRDKAKIASKRAFHNFVTQEQPMTPKELKAYDFLLLDTSKENPQQCAKKCVDFISK